MSDGTPDSAPTDAWVMPGIPGKAQAAVAAAVSVFGASATPKLAGPGEPEDQLRSPLETLLVSVAKDLGLRVNPVGESSLSDLKVKPDYAIEVDGALAGYIEVKAPGKGADPTAWGIKNRDRQQWEKLKELPNVLYTDGNSWALYSKGVRNGPVVHLKGDVRTSGARLTAEGSGLAGILDTFLRWEPQAPRTLSALVNSVAGLCRLLREEVAEALAKERLTGGPFTSLAADWRELLFPDADDAEFADGYAQTVTFALLLARVERIDFTGQPISEIARQLGKGHSLMGKALSVLTDDSLGELTRTIDTLLRVVGAVEWGKFEDKAASDKIAGRRSKRNDPYLHLYEKFLEVYDPKLRKRTGSYYTPVEVVDSMIRMVDGLLKDRLGQPLGFASDQVVVVDPAMGTGTYLLNVIEHAALAIAEDEGQGSVPARLRRMASRVIGFERQAGPYAVAEMRAYEALRRHRAEPPVDGLRLYVADTLDNPNAEVAHIFAGHEPIARSRQAANKVKRDEPVMVVIGNPPYKDQAKGKGGWVESGNPKGGEQPLMNAFRAPGNGRYEKTLSNLYVYFWRWATWKVFDGHPESPAGVVAFITPSGYLAGPGFDGMREYLRRRADEAWIIDVTPEGFQPPVNTRPFAGVQQPLAIAVFARYGSGHPDTPAAVHYRQVAGLRDEKFDRLSRMELGGAGWETTATGWQDPFLPANQASWGSFPSLGDDLMPWQTGGVHQQRTWPNAPDAETLRQRWRRLTTAPAGERPLLLKETTSRKADSRVEPIGGGPALPKIVEEANPEPVLVRYAYRSFDRQWLIADSRVIDRPAPELWRVLGDQQVFATESHALPVVAGPALTFTALIPNLDHYYGRGGRVIPLHRDPATASPNLAPGLVQHLAEALGLAVTPEDVLAYIAATVAHPDYTARFRDDLQLPGVRVPITASPDLWQEAVALGSRVIWLHTYGERYADPAHGRPAGPPKVARDIRPMSTMPIPDTAEGMPDTMRYDPGTRTLHVGDGQIHPVSPAVVAYKVNTMSVLTKWFGYRKRRPDGLRNSPLNDTVATAWTSETTTELLNLLNVLTGLIETEPAQASLLERILAGPMVTVTDLKQAGVVPPPDRATKPARTTAAADDLLSVLQETDQGGE